MTLQNCITEIQKIHPYYGKNSKGYSINFLFPAPKNLNDVLLGYNFSFYQQNEKEYYKEVIKAYDDFDIVSVFMPDIRTCLIEYYLKQ